MIKLFGKIRYNLMETGKTGKYFKYAIGEILLVVIGILIALQINNWNQNRVNTTKEQEYLIGLKNDLEKQIASFNDIDWFYNQLIETGESILTDYTNKSSLIEIDSINKRLSFIMYTSGYPEINTTFNELNTTGQINLIEDKTLRSQIIEYYQNSKSHKASVDGNTLQVIYAQIFPVLKSSVIISPENFNFNSVNLNKEKLKEKLDPAFKNNLENPTKEFEIINAISLRIIVAKTNRGYTLKALEEAKLLLDEVSKSL